ncbi:hypothetical protein KIN20_023866 [Parelaphostrongylus tenuis]|uniref:Uncharacterized protein n=1 Tax=Parelaphostrongylus tenuis TaxID=148309 RepID=A0AAD5MXI9_PARTN|nr:hypothetical protein KIN20_023866 [Parelaphostrongylus tenuis]
MGTTKKHHLTLDRKGPLKPRNENIGMPYLKSTEEGVFAETSSTSNQENSSTETKDNQSGKRYQPREA